MRYQPVAEISPREYQDAIVYAEGWQSWSPLRMCRFGESSGRAPDGREQLVGWRPGKPVPEGVIQAEGVLAVAPAGRPARAWFAAEPSREVPTLRLTARGELTADGRVEELQAANLASVLAAVGDRLSAPKVAPIAPGWSSWSCYFDRVTEADVAENVEAALRLQLPIGIVQIDDGYQTAVGDWLDVRPTFGSLRRAAERTREAGMVPGIWVAPFMVDPQSSLATTHPDWLVQGADAGLHWDRRMRILDVTHPAAAEHLATVFRTLAGWGFGYFKLDFLYAGAVTGLEAYRTGLELIRAAIGPTATVLACGAPLLPSIGLCDAMRVGPDVLPETPDPQLDIETLTRVTGMRSWMNGRLWVNDPDHLVARPEIREREAWASYLETYGGVAFSSDRLTALDERGFELTRRVLGEF